MTLVSPFQSAEASPVYGDIKRGLTHGNDKIFSEDEIVFSEHMVRENPLMLGLMFPSFVNLCLYPWIIYFVSYTIGRSATFDL